MSIQKNNRDMESFDLQAHLDEIYSNFPPEYWKPVIGITANYAEGEARLMDRYYKQVVSAGGVPVPIRTLSSIP